jgi:hypothetical protein
VCPASPALRDTGLYSDAAIDDFTIVIAGSDKNLCRNLFLVSLVLNFDNVVRLIARRVVL